MNKEVRSTLIYLFIVVVESVLLIIPTGWVLTHSNIFISNSNNPNGVYVDSKGGYHDPQVEEKYGLKKDKPIQPIKPINAGYDPNLSVLTDVVKYNNVD